MNHYTAFQPPHLDGKWQYVTLNKRGGGPICGCARDEGHDTREDAERHLYDTGLANVFVSSWEDQGTQRRCEIVGCEEWTSGRTTIRIGHFHDNVHTLCTAHQVVSEDIDAIASLVPFRAGFESYGTY